MDIRRLLVEGGSHVIVTVGGIKGGSGKTTVATNLAVIRAAAGRDVLLVDADDQATASDFTMLRNQRLGADAGFTSIMLGGAAVRTETRRLCDKYDDIIIDTGGRDTTSQRAALTVSDVLLVPFVPRSFDVWTLESVSELIAEIRTVNPELAAFAFINRADPRGVDNAQAEDVIRDTPELTWLPARLGTRKAFGNAAAQGLAVTELRPQDVKATGEIMALCRQLEGG